MDAKKAITLYKNRDASEKVFRADKSYLGNNCLRVASEEAASNKIFIGSCSVKNIKSCAECIWN